MRKALGLIGVLLCFGGAGAAEAYVLVEVQSGGVILVEENGEVLSLELAGIWVPDPPGPSVKGDYRGVEARRYVEQLLLNQPAYIREMAPRRDDGDEVRVRVRIRLGEEGEYDLAVSLAHAGLGILDRATATDPEYLDAIHRAERLARVAQQGMHDGGYETFVRDRDQRGLSFGVGTLDIAPAPRYGLQAYLGDPAGASSHEPRQSRVNSNAIKTIRDWGGAMGLPVDHSSMGR